ncbi:MAG TPA: SURF1 family protein [Micromonosporaceae bacterium]
MPDVYRFLVTPRWLALALVMALAAVTMVFLGRWQLHRYQYRSEVNARIDAAGQRAPLSLGEAMAAPVGGGVGAPPTAALTWSMVSVTGHYDPSHQVLARIRSLNDTVGFEVLTPLVLDDGTAVLVDRGWLPASADDVDAAPDVPAAPTGTVVVVGRVHAPESRAAAPEPFAGWLAVRRIDPATMTSAVPYPLYGGYITLQSQTPPADPAFSPIPPDHQNSALNAAYTFQWWLFALMTVVGFGYVAYRHVHPLPDDRAGHTGPPAPPAADEQIAPAVR